MKAFRKSSVPQLDIEATGRILAQAFEASQMELNTIPPEVLASYRNYRRERFTLQRTILVIIMTLFLLLPFLFVPSSFSVQIQSFGPETGAADTCFNPVYRLEVDSFMLVERVNATVDGHNVPVYETDSHVYSIEPHQNGKMAVTVTLVNSLSCRFSNQAGEETFPCPLNTASAGQFYIFRINFFSAQN